MTEAYPLKWPDGWPRTPESRREDGSRFIGGSAYESDGSGGMKYVGRKPVSFDRARKLLADELDRLNAKSVVLSTNLPLRLDGLPRADAARHRMTDPGVAVYFTYKNRQMVMAADRYSNVASNMRSLGLAIEAMRQLERHGGGAMMERAFTGFSAIEPPGGAWRAILGFAAFKEEAITPALVDQHYRDRARKAHPDAGGTADQMSRLNNARDAAHAWLEAQ